jgi:cupin 2 domain-containing protein
MVEGGNIFRDLPQAGSAAERLDLLAGGPSCRIERIVSTGQITPDGAWYDQERPEWVLLVAGVARLRIEGEAADRELAAGDWLLLPAHCRHRVTFTQASPPCIWLAVHFAPDETRL